MISAEAIFGHCEKALKRQFCRRSNLTEKFQNGFHGGENYFEVNL